LPFVERKALGPLLARTTPHSRVPIVERILVWICGGNAGLALGLLANVTSTIVGAPAPRSRARASTRPVGRMDVEREIRRTSRDTRARIAVARPAWMSTAIAGRVREWTGSVILFTVALIAQ